MRDSSWIHVKNKRELRVKKWEEIVSEWERERMRIEKRVNDLVSVREEGREREKKNSFLSSHSFLL